MASKTKRSTRGRRRDRYGRFLKRGSGGGRGKKRGGRRHNPAAIVPLAGMNPRPRRNESEPARRPPRRRPSSIAIISNPFTANPLDLGIGIAAGAGANYGLGMWLQGKRDELTALPENAGLPPEEIEKKLPVSPLVAHGVATVAVGAALGLLKSQQAGIGTIVGGLGYLVVMAIKKAKEEAELRALTEQAAGEALAGAAPAPAEERTAVQQAGQATEAAGGFVQELGTIFQDDGTEPVIPANYSPSGNPFMRRVEGTGLDLADDVGLLGAGGVRLRGPLAGMQLRGALGGVPLADDVGLLGQFPGQLKPGGAESAHAKAERRRRHPQRFW